MPPLAETVARPVIPPSHPGFVLELITALKILSGWVIVVLLVDVHPWLSVTVTV